MLNYTEIHFWHSLHTDTYLHNQLVGPGHQSEAVGVVESLRDVLAESVAGASRGDAPATTVVRVWPQQVTHGTLRKKKRKSRRSTLAKKYRHNPAIIYMSSHHHDYCKYTELGVKGNTITLLPFCFIGTIMINLLLLTFVVDSYFTTTACLFMCSSLFYCT